MSISIETTPDSYLRFKAYFDFQNDTDFLKVVETARSLTKRLTSALVTARERADTDKARLLNSKVRAIAAGLMKYSQEHEQRFRETPFYKVARSMNDWMSLLLIPLVQDNGIEPLLGVPGVFYCVVDGFEYEVVYTPHRFSVEMDHYAFRHVFDGQYVNAKCPISETGGKSLWITFDETDKHGSVSKAACAFIEALQVIPSSECRQRDLF